MKLTYKYIFNFFEYVKLLIIMFRFLFWGVDNFGFENEDFVDQIADWDDKNYITFGHTGNQSSRLFCPTNFGSGL